MAVGFTPKHVENIPLNNLTKEQFLAIAYESIKKLGWELAYSSTSGLVAYTSNKMFTWNSEFKVVFEDDFAAVSSTSVGSEMVDWGKNKRRVERFITAFDELKVSLTEEEITAQYEALKAEFAPEEEDLLKLPPTTAKEDFKHFLSFFIPSKDFFVTPLLIDINILIFIIMAVCGVSIFEPTTEALISWGANFRPVTLDGQLWRLITNCFLHIGIFHLLMNMYALLYIGILLEPILGKSRFITAYLLTGIVASLTSLWWHELTVSAGASGAIFGMYGVFLALLTTDFIEKTARKAFLISIGIFVGYNLINGLKAGVDNAAHVGGLISGLAVGYAFIFSLKRPTENKLKYATIGLLSIIILTASFFFSKTFSNDMVKYETALKEFDRQEKQALSVYSLPEGTSKEDVLYEIKSRGMYYWEENIKLVDNMQKLDLPDEIKAQNKILKEYCELRLANYKLIYKAVAEDTQKYKSQIEECNLKIGNKLNQLKEASANQE